MQGEIKTNIETNVEEMHVFLAMLLLSGYNPRSQRRLWWESSDDVFCKAMSDAMPRNRFEELIAVVRFADNMNLEKGDKMAKIRHFYDLLNARFRKYAPNKETTAVDESMVPYFGNHGAKQRIQNKSVRVGYKMWVLAERSGYIVYFDPYQGAKNGKSCKA